MLVVGKRRGSGFLFKTMQALLLLRECEKDLSVEARGFLKGESYCVCIPGAQSQTQLLPELLKSASAEKE